jgi:hypothetical protein
MSLFNQMRFLFSRYFSTYLRPRTRTKVSPPLPLFVVDSSHFQNFASLWRMKCCSSSVFPQNNILFNTHLTKQTNLTSKTKVRNYTNNQIRTQTKNSSFTSASPTKTNLKFSVPHHDSTIFAVATPPGRAALAIIRISGPRATDVSDSLQTLFSLSIF